MTYLLCDFSNAVRKAFTQIKKAELLGEMGKKIKKNNPDTAEIKELLTRRYNLAKAIQRNGGDTQGGLATGIEKIVKNINRKRKANKKDVRSYVDAAQIARRGKITPIKADTYIDRSGYIQYPQDNTVLAGTINKIDKNTRKTGTEYGTTLYKDGNRLKASKVVEGDEGSVKAMSTLPTNKEALIDIHSHPDAIKVSDNLSVLPSVHDLKLTRSKTSLIVSPQIRGRTITKYEATTKPFKQDNKLDLNTYTQQYRKQVRQAGGDYTVITKGKNQ